MLHIIMYARVVELVDTLVLGAYLSEHLNYYTVNSRNPCYIGHTAPVNGRIRLWTSESIPPQFTRCQLTL